MTVASAPWLELDRRLREEVGVILLTVLEFTHGGSRMHRVYSSHPDQYPVGGWKDVTTEVSSEWVAISRDSAATFIAPTPNELREIFADSRLIESLGVGAILNVPLRRADGSNWGTVNICGTDGTYTPERVALAERIVSELAYASNTTIEGAIS